MNTGIGFRRNHLAIRLACAAAATGLGLAYLAAAGAPALHLVVNALSLVIGLAIVITVHARRLHVSGRTPLLPGGVVVALGGLLLVTALFGEAAEGASRWIRFGALSLQTSLIVLPLMLLAFAHRRDLLTTLGVALAAVALALQPDRAMAGVLLGAVAVLAFYRRDRWVVSAVAVAVAGFTVSLIRPDSLPAVPYVDQILHSAFEVHILAGVAVVGGSLLLLVPAIAGYWLDPENRHIYAVFGALWLGMVAAAALGNYPTPLVGYGGSAILGYAFSLSCLPGGARPAAADVWRAGDGSRSGEDAGADLRFGALGW